MVFTLHRYIFRELFKVFVFAAVALTLILSLGSILRPVQEYGVGPRQVVHLMGYFLPITLTFVLPMAALFASALVYGRFASDNELDACKASGISPLTLVYPGLALAIMVATANLILSFHMMPYFVHLAEKSLKADAKQILFRNIQRRGYLSFYHVRTRDFNKDTKVDFKDFAILASYWHETNCSDLNDCEGTDLDIDGDVDSNDLRLFVEYWLERTE